VSALADAPQAIKPKTTKNKVPAARFRTLIIFLPSQFIRDISSTAGFD
jgi:hypothetical protein